MSAPTGVVLGLAPLEEEAIEEALYGSGGALRVLASGADAGELLELAATRSPDLVLVSAGLPGLDARALARLRALGPRVAGLALDERAEARLAELDADLVLRAPLRAGLDDLLADHGQPAGDVTAAEAAPQTRPARAGAIVAVVGTRGSPGSSALAASFAALVERHYQVLLVELDGDGGRLVSALGLAARERMLGDLARALAAGSPDADGQLARATVEPTGGWPAVLLAASDPDDGLSALGAPGVAPALLDLTASRYALVVCDLGHRLVRGGADDLAVSLHREVVRAADAVIAVLGARPDQLAAGLSQLDLLLDDVGVAPEALRVVVNGQPGIRVPRAAPAAAAIVGELAERGLTIDAWLPFDERALNAASRRRLPLALAGRRSPYARVIAELAALILLPGLARPAPRKRRLRPGAPVTQPPSAREEVALPWRR